MNLLEALKEIQEENNPELWFRPVGWEGCALTIKDKITYQVPSSTGGERYMTDYLTELQGEWEIVLADDVLGEIE